MTLTVGAVIVGVSFLNVFVLVTTDNKPDIWLIIMALGMILVAISSILSEMESQSSILKNIEDLVKKKNKKENKNIKEGKYERKNKK